MPDNVRRHRRHSRRHRKGYVPLGTLSGLLFAWCIFLCYLPYLVRML